MKKSQELRLAVHALEEAGAVVRKGYGRIKTVTEKRNQEIVTDVDRRSERVIRQALNKESPHAILGEEGEKSKALGTTYWTVDPLDGTSNFSRNIPFFSISIALIKKDIISVGAILHPLTGELFYAERGRGVFKNGKAISVSKLSALQKSILFVNHGYALEDRVRYGETTKRFSSIASLKKLGSTALELCYVAQGSAEAFLSSGDELWDYAAGLLFVEEAGGKVTDWRGNQWDNTNSFILASNGLVHEEILKELLDFQ